MSNFLINDISLMTVECKEHKHKIIISPKSHILAFENSYTFTVNEEDRVNKHSSSKYMPLLHKENFKISSNLK